MKKKGSRSIPDFSGKRGTPPVAGAPARKVAGAPSVPAPRERVKPHATSAKSGRRGQ